MVHALKEAWRVLVNNGTMIDVRPLSVVVPLEVAWNGKSALAGDADMTPDLKYDLASDKAIDKVVAEGLFVQTGIDTFDYAYYWKTYHGMVVDFAERWQDEIIVSKEVLDRARTLYKQNFPDARLRLPMRMKLATYVKQVKS